MQETDGYEKEIKSFLNVSKHHNWACFDSFCQVWWMCIFFLKGGGPTGMFPLIRYERISSRWGLSRLHSSTNKGKWKGGFFSQPLDLRGRNHMAITPSWRAPFISPSHLWLPAPGFKSPATDWWNSAAFVQCCPAYRHLRASVMNFSEMQRVNNMGIFGF